MRLGRVTDRGEPRAAAHRAIRDYVERGREASGLEPDVVAGEAAWRVRLQFPRSVLIDWLFAHGGWLFAAGVLCRSGDSEPTMIERARAVLDTWEWIEPKSEAASLPPLWRGCDSIPPPAG